MPPLPQIIGALGLFLAQVMTANSLGERVGVRGERGRENAEVIPAARGSPFDPPNRDAEARTGVKREFQSFPKKLRRDTTTLVVETETDHPSDEGKHRLRACLIRALFS